MVPQCNVSCYFHLSNQNTFRTTPLKINVTSVTQVALPLCRDRIGSESIGWSRNIKFHCHVILILKSAQMPTITLAIAEFIASWIAPATRNVEYELHVFWLHDLTKWNVMCPKLKCSVLKCNFPVYSRWPRQYELIFVPEFHIRILPTKQILQKNGLRKKNIKPQLSKRLWEHFIRNILFDETICVCAVALCFRNLCAFCVKIKPFETHTITFSFSTVCKVKEQPVPSPYQVTSSCPS